MPTNFSVYDVEKSMQYLLNSHASSVSSAYFFWGKDNVQNIDKELDTKPRGGYVYSEDTQHYSFQYGDPFGNGEISISIGCLGRTHKDAKWLATQVVNVLESHQKVSLYNFYDQEKISSSSKTYGSLQIGTRGMQSTITERDESDEETQKFRIFVESRYTFDKV